MNVTELNREQLTELKERHITAKTEALGTTLTLDMLLNVDDYVSDREILLSYAGTKFVNDDFFCSAKAV